MGNGEGCFSHEGSLNHEEREEHEDKYFTFVLFVSFVVNESSWSYCPRSFRRNGDSKKNPSTCTSIGSSMRTPATPPLFSVTVNESPAMADRVGVASTTAPLTRYETAVGATCTSSVFTALPLASGFLIA